MNTNEIIGSKVWVVENGRIKDKTVYTIVGVKLFSECHDYCNHYVIRGEDGKETEVRETLCVFTTKENLEGEAQIDQYLRDNGCIPDDVYHSNGQLCVYISWGDWKHSFIWLDNLMGYIGYQKNDELVTEEDGSDCYSAIHYFTKAA